MLLALIGATTAILTGLWQLSASSRYGKFRSLSKLLKLSGVQSKVAINECKHCTSKLTDDVSESEFAFNVSAFSCIFPPGAGFCFSANIY